MPVRIVKQDLELVRFQLSKVWQEPQQGLPAIREA